MQTGQQISFDKLHEVVAAVFAQGPVVLRQAYSDFGCATKEFADVRALLDELHYEPSVALDRAGMTVFRDIALFAAGPASERSRSIEEER